MWRRSCIWSQRDLYATQRRGSKFRRSIADGPVDATMTRAEATLGGDYEAVDVMTGGAISLALNFVVVVNVSVFVASDWFCC